MLSTRSLLAASALVFVLSAAYRFASPELSDDDFMFLSRGRQMLVYGELPCRDFRDEGRPLQYAVSALGQALFGYRLLGEAVFDLGFIALGCAITAWLCGVLSGSASVSILMGVLVTLLGTRPYNHTKYFILPAGLALVWVFISRKSTRSLAALGGFLAVAFVFRHDFAIYLGTTVAAALLVVHWQYGWRAVSRRGALLGTVGLLAVSPYLVFVQIHEGVLAHFEEGFRFTEREYQKEIRRPRFEIPDAAAFVTILPAELPPRPTVYVRWTAEVAPELRSELERRHRLEKPGIESGRTWRYELADGSRSTIGSLVNDPHVEDTHNIDRSRLAVVNTPREPIGAWLTRWIPLLRLRSPALMSHANAVAWLYDLAFAVPVAALGLLVLRRIWRVPARVPDEGAKVLVASVLALLTSILFLRESLSTSGRLTEVGPQTAVLAAWIVGLAMHRAPAERTAGRLAVFAARVGVALVLIVTTLSIGSVGSVRRQLERAGLFEGSHGLAQQARAVRLDLLTSPPVERWAPEGSTGLRALVRYVHACTRPTDKVFLTWSAPHVYYYSGRGFAGDRPFVFRGFWATDADQQRTLARMRAERIPIVLLNASPYEDTTRAERFSKEFPLLLQHLATRYATVAESSFGGPVDEVFRVLVDSDLKPTDTYGPLGLPCFR